MGTTYFRSCNDRVVEAIKKGCRSGTSSVRDLIENELAKLSN